jgi:hypothetical protein
MKYNINDTRKEEDEEDEEVQLEEEEPKQALLKKNEVKYNEINNIKNQL